MRESHTIDLFDKARPSVVLDVMHAEHLKALAATPVHGGARLARLLEREAPRIAVVPAGGTPADVDRPGAAATGRHPRRPGIGAVPVGTALIGRSEGAFVACAFPAGRTRPLTLLRVTENPAH